MDLPISQEDRREISEAYKRAATEIAASAASLEALAEMLEQRMACLAPGSRKALEGPFALAGASLFKLGVLRFKVQNANLEGREFLALDASPPEP